MGNLCSKSSNKPDHFAQPGRVLGSSGQSAGTAPTPRKVTLSTPGRTLGGQSGTASDNSAKSAAARAAEERAATVKRQTTGKLGAQLDAQKKQTRNELLAAGSEQERRARDADAAAEARTYN